MCMCAFLKIRTLLWYNLRRSDWPNFPRGNYTFPNACTFVRTQTHSEVQDNRKETGAIESSLCLDFGPNLITSIVFQGPKNDNKHIVIDKLKELKN